MKIYLFYTLIFFLAIFSMYMYDISKKKYFYIFSFLSMWIPATFRYSFRGDFSIYNKIFIEQVNGVLRMHFPFEIGYSLLSELIAGLKLPFSVLIGIISFMTYFVLFLALPKEKKHLFLSVYMGLIYIESLQTIRSNLAVAFFILGIRLLLNEKLKKTILSLIVGISFHRSLIIGFTIFFVKLKKVKYWFIIIILIFLVIRRFNLTLTMLNTVAPYLPGHYSYYLSSRADYIEKVQNIIPILLGPGFFLRNFILLVVFFKGKEMIEKNKNNVYIITLSLIYMFFLLMNFEMSMLYRLKELFTLSLLFLYEEIGNLYFSKSKKYSLFLFIIMFLVYIATLRNFFILESSIIDTTIFMNFPKF